MRVRRSSAFTLIELLIVVAIIAILAAILFPVFQRAREQAKQSVCATQLKEIGTAMLMYAGDYNNRAPLHYGMCPPYTAFYDVLPKYMKRRFGSFTCPVDPDGCYAWRAADQPTDRHRTVSARGITGYATWQQPWTATPSGQPVNEHQNRCYSLGEIVDPARCPYMWDAIYDFVDGTIGAVSARGQYKLEVTDWGDGLGWRVGIDGRTPVADPYCWVAGRHGGYPVVLYFDGHVKWLNYTCPLRKVKRLPIYNCPWWSNCLNPATYYAPDQYPRPPY